MSDQATDQESSQDFVQRKQDHIMLSLEDRNEARGQSGFERIRLVHEALPELDFSEIDITTTVFGERRATPFLVSSMTAGHRRGVDLNQQIAKACESRGWLMGVGSQRRELNDPEAYKEWESLRKTAPEVALIGNLGMSQAVHTKPAVIQTLVDHLQAKAMIIHLNPLQECVQPEGTPRFKGGLEALQTIAAEISVPLIVKETGCGFSSETLQKLMGRGLGVVDVSGFGGTHWGRIEGVRAQESAETRWRHELAQSFKDWGIPTVNALLFAAKIKPDYKIWASGGLRSGLDAAKALSMGAQVVGFAKPALESALKGELELWMMRIEYELRTALFCTGCQNIDALQERRVWRPAKIKI